MDDNKLCDTVTPELKENIESNVNTVESNIIPNYDALANELQKNSKASSSELQKTDESLVIKLQKLVEEDIKPQITIDNSMFDDIHRDASKQAINTADFIYRDWSKKEDDEITQRKGLTCKIFWFLVVQWGVAVVLILLQGKKEWFNISETIFISFFAAIIIQTIAIVIVIAKYLFKERNTRPLDIIVELISITGLNNANYKDTTSSNADKKDSVK